MTQDRAKPHYTLQNFEGPLDLLLFLIKKNEVSIYAIPIAKITEQYIDYLRYITQKDLEELTEFYLLATTLLYIKSQTLLPFSTSLEEEEGEDPRKELVAKLIEYQKFKKLSSMISQQEQELQFQIHRSKKQRFLPLSQEDDGVWQQIKIWDLLKSFSLMTENLPSDRLISLYEEVSTTEKISLLFRLLAEKGEILFEELILDSSSLMEIVSSFFALLEVSKTGKITLSQNRFLGVIKIKRN